MPSRAQRSASHDPGEDALDADDQVVPVGLDGEQEGRCIRGHVAVQQDVALGVQDAEVHGARVQVDAAGVLVALGVESHRSLLGDVGTYGHTQATGRSGSSRRAFMRIKPYQTVRASPGC